MIATCALCKKDKELRDSHIIPKFVFNWMKKTGSLNFRKVITSNKRDQDGPKLKLLCNDCEQKFSKFETWYSRSIFHPILDDMLANKGQHTKLSFEYNENLYAFCMSFLWRALKVNIQSNDCPGELIPLLNEVESEWRMFLHKNQFPVRWNKIHMWVLDKIDDFAGKPPAFDLYIMRSTDATIAHGEGQLFVFAKAARFMFFAPLIGFENEKLFVNTLINPLGGNFIIPQFIEDPRIGEFIVNRVNQISGFAVPLSETQQEKILEQARKDYLFGSDLHRALIDDFD